jgi:hypothetical protein
VVGRDEEEHVVNNTMKEKLASTLRWAGMKKNM